MGKFAIIDENNVVERVANSSLEVAQERNPSKTIVDVTDVYIGKDFTYDPNTGEFTPPDAVPKLLQGMRAQVVEELRNVAFLMDEMPAQKKAAWIAYRQQLVASARAANAAQNPDLFSWPDRPSDDPVTDLL